MICFYYFAGIFFGVFPSKKGVSWEGHLFGAIAGIIVAYNYRKEGPQIKKYNWDNEDDVLDVLTQVIESNIEYMISDETSFSFIVDVFLKSILNTILTI